MRGDGVLHARRVRIVTPGKRTRCSNRRCYAAALGDCSRQISVEHFISKSVLTFLSLSDLVSIQGLPWQIDGESNTIPASRLGSKILCERHNHALSPLDDVGARFFRSLDGIHDSFRDPGVKLTSVHLFSGHDIERWLLKLFCGLVSSEQASSQTGVITDWAPPVPWLRMLFRGKILPLGWGFYFLGEVGETQLVTRDFSVAPLSNPTMGAYGLLVSVFGRRFLFCMATPPDDRSSTLLRDSIYRPAELVFKGGSQEHILKLSWDQYGTGRAIVIAVDGL